MKAIEELQDVPFEKIENIYKENEVSPPLEEMIKDPVKAINEEYLKVLEEPVYQRATDNNIFCEGGICVQGLGGYPDVSLEALILFSIVFRICQKIEYNGKEYSVSIFTEKILSDAIKTELKEPLDEVLSFQYCRSKFLLKKDGEKLMFIFSDEVDNDEL